MNTKRDPKPRRGFCMTILLWGINDAPGGGDGGLHVVFQLYFIERNYVSSNIAEVRARDPYSRQTTDGHRIISYEYGVPALYNGEQVYLIVYHSFAELYAVPNMNRQQLIILTVILTLAAAVLAALLSKLFTRPILAIKRTAA